MNRRVLGFVGFLFLLGQAISLAVEEDRAIEVGRDALVETAWYDPEVDQLQSVPVTRRSVDEVNRASRWDPRPKKVNAPAANPAAPAPPIAPGGGGGGFNFGEIFGWIVLALLITAVTTVVVYAFMSREPSQLTKEKKAVPVKNTQETLQSRLEQLPVKVEIAQGDLLSQARNLASSGRFDLAIIYLFSQTLLQLDRRHRIRLALGKTNRQYLRELRDAADLRTATMEIVQTFESSYFGGHTPSRDRFAECLHFYERIEKELLRSGGVLVLFLCTLLCLGCGQGLDTTYGKSRGVGASESINGYAAIRNMFVAYGWEAKDDSRLAERLHRAKALIWLPKQQTGFGGDFVEAPTVEHQQWISQWLAGGSGRTFIYVFPGYDAELDYYEAAREFAVGPQRLEYRRQRAQVLTRKALAAKDLSVSCEWFAINSIHPSSQEQEFEGLWNSPSNLQLTVSAQVAPVQGTLVKGKFRSAKKVQAVTASPEAASLTFEPLLADQQGNVLAARWTAPQWNDSQFLVVACPSFLVNFAFVDPAKRPVAAQLVEQCGEPERIVFLEPLSALSIQDEAAGPYQPSGMELFTRWPLNIFTMHVAAIGLLVLLAMAPIFGRPQRLQVASRTDFGRHITGLGELLMRTGDSQAARERISDYFEHVRREPESVWVLPKSQSSSLNSSSGSTTQVAKSPFAGIGAASLAGQLPPPVAGEPKPEPPIQGASS